MQQKSECDHNICLCCIYSTTLLAIAALLSGGKFQYDGQDDTAVCLTFRVSKAVMLLLVAASDLGLFTFSAFSFLKILRCFRVVIL